MPVTSQITVGQLVAERPGRSRVFQQLGVDFCCGRKMSLEDACRRKGLDPNKVLQMLLAGDGESTGETDVTGMGLAELCVHIEQTHHAYLKEELPRLGTMIRKVAAVHGFENPWTMELAGVFAAFSAQLESHMLKEEQALFPMIRSMETDGVAPSNGGIEQIITVMKHEHDDAGEALRRFRELSHDYTPPDGACNTFRAMLAGLAELEVDMHHHVHKESHVLFPKAIRFIVPD